MTDPSYSSPKSDNCPLGDGFGLLVASLRAGVEDATARPSQRQRARLTLRRDMLKSLRAIEARIDAADPPEHGDPAGLSSPL